MKRIMQMIHKGDRYKQAKKTASNMLKNGEPMEKL